MGIESFISNIKGSVRESDPEDVDPEEMEEAVPDDILPPDPKPVRRTKAGPKPAPARVNANIRKQVTDSLTMMITIPAGIVMFRDPICAGAVLDQVDPVVARLVPIVCRNPAMLRWFTEGAGYMDWLALAAALAPIGKVFWSHHVTGSINEQEDEDDGDFSRYSAPAFAA